MTNGRSLLSVAAVAAAVTLAFALVAFVYRGTIIREYLANNPDEVQRVVRDVLVNNPAVLQEAIAEFIRAQQGGGPEPDRSAVIQNHAQMLFSSTHQVTVGNPQGDVTLVEFFDYNCPYCRRAFGDVVALLKEDTKLKVVFKEFPILSPASTDVAQVAIGVRMQDPTGQKYMEFRQKVIASRGQATKDIALTAAKDLGLDLARLEKDMTSDEVKQTLTESMQLARALGIDATPCYVIGNSVVFGAVGVDALKEKIQAAREAKGK